MAREKKPKQIELISDERKGLECWLMLDQMKLTFFADFAGDHYESAVAADVRGLVKVAMKNASDFVWHGLIEVRTGKSSGGSGTPDEPTGVGIRCHIFRYWWTITPGGKYVQCDWKYQTDLARASNMQSWSGGERSIKERVDESNYQDERTHYIDYDEATWQGLTILIRSLIDVKNKIADLLRSDQESLKLSGAGAAALLPAVMSTGDRRWYLTMVENNPVTPTPDRPEEGNPAQRGGLYWMDNGLTAYREWYAKDSVGRSSFGKKMRDEWRYMTAQEAGYTVPVFRLDNHASAAGTSQLTSDDSLVPADVIMAFGQPEVFDDVEDQYVFVKTDGSIWTLYARFEPEFPDDQRAGFPDDQRAEFWKRTTPELFFYGGESRHEGRAEFITWVREQVKNVLPF